MSFEPREVPRRVQGAESSRLGRETVVLDPSGKMLRGLNPTAGRIWDLIDGRRTVAEIAEALAAEVQAPVERVLADVRTFLDALAERALVARASGGGS